MEPEGVTVNCLSVVYLQFQLLELLFTFRDGSVLGSPMYGDGENLPFS